MFGKNILGENVHPFILKLVKVLKMAPWCWEIEYNCCTLYFYFLTNMNIKLMSITLLGSYSDWRDGGSAVIQWRARRRWQRVPQERWRRPDEWRRRPAVLEWNDGSAQGRYAHAPQCRGQLDTVQVSWRWRKLLTSHTYMIQFGYSFNQWGCADTLMLTSDCMSNNTSLQHVCTSYCKNKNAIGLQRLSGQYIGLILNVFLF